MKQVYCKEGTLCSKYPLEPRKVIKKFIAGSIWAIFMLVFLSILFLSIPFWHIEGANLQTVTNLRTLWLSDILTISLLWVLFIVGSICEIIYEIFYYRFYFYDLTEKELIIRKGVITRRELTIPFYRIQDVYVDQDFWDRIFGLYDVHVATAATGGAFAGSERAHIDGVDAENAEVLKKIFIEKIRMGEPIKTGI